MLKAVQNKPYLFWAIIGAAVYIPFLGSTHLFDWDEVNFAESAREMKRAVLNREASVFRATEGRVPSS